MKILNWRYIFSILSAVRWQMDDVAKSIALFEDLLKKYPNDGPVCEMLGMCLIRNNDIERGVHSLEEALKWIKSDDKHLPEVYAYLGYGYLMQKNYQKAIKYNLLALDYWDDSIKKLPIEFSKEQIYENLGLSYEEEDQLDDAIISYRKGIEINHRNISLLERLVRSYYLNEEYDKAKMYLDQMLLIDPKLYDNEEVKEASYLIDRQIGTRDVQK